MCIHIIYIYISTYVVKLYCMYVLYIYIYVYTHTYTIYCVVIVMCMLLTKSKALAVMQKHAFAEIFVTFDGCYALAIKIHQRGLQWKQGVVVDMM